MKFNDADYREKIRNASSPKQAKDMGQSRQVTIDPSWDVNRDTVMKYALMMKFSHSKLKQILLSTRRRELVEKSHFDKNWGAGRDGKSKNRLGKLLMEVRSELYNDA